MGYNQAPVANGLRVVLGMGDTTKRLLVMKTYGIIHGDTIQLEGSPDLPEGQAVEVELRPLSEDPVLAAAREIRDRFLQRWGQRLDLSLRFLHEDRER